ncbi:hypothetical protein BC939DRAFT_461812 [Gamsiella multidivaricata]|uniref:uncharacterized protein n=1 Tax=Gamsiella multidivaricata TaxID=101098 RepID=UPI00222045A5|nr:uncharacterized protein BC939DRAFT_461812 [Gamsiella multidivaricata]KAI7818863.1 hypothetical protein BC939DRAFT_461812 [Gamsiella multidivaricata]
MNRKNPETQRWQFYHPHFQRDFPHLRKNIKRKSARSMNTAPATSRVVFEHGKGYFLQRNDRSRSNSGEGGQHSGLAYKSSLPPHHHQHHPQAPPSRHLGQPSPTMRPTTGGRHPSLTNSLREPEVRDSTLV